MRNGIQKTAQNVILIGMPGVGKSTVGVVLAKRLGFAFLDSDLVIQEREGRLLHEIISEKGVEGFWKVEEEANLSIETQRTVIATGGSAIYGRRAMEHFSQMGAVVYLKLPLEAIAERLGDLAERGVTLKEGQDLQALYEERVPMYERCADIIMDCEGKQIREIVKEIAGRIAAE
jgi:shikimate kinase